MNESFPFFPSHPSTSDECMNECDATHRDGTTRSIDVDDEDDDDAFGRRTRRDEEDEEDEDDDARARVIERL